MLPKIFRRLRRQKSQPRVVLVPPNLSLRDSFGSPFPHISEGGYSLYYELELLQRRRTEKEMQNITISSKPIHPHAPSYPQTQIPQASASSSRHPLPPPPRPSMSMPMPLPHQNHNATRNSTRSRRPGLEKIPELSPDRPSHSVRKRKKIKNLKQLVQTQAAEVERAMMLAASQMDTPGTALSHFASSSCGHGTADTPPTTVEDLAEDELGAVVNFKVHDYDQSHNICAGARSSPSFDRPGSRSSYYTARTHFSDL